MKNKTTDVAFVVKIFIAVLFISDAFILSWKSKDEVVKKITNFT